MTTGLIGIPGTAAVRARVAVVAQDEGREMADLLQRAGHYHEEFDDWSEFRSSCDSGEVWDLVLYGATVATGVPEGVEVPGFRVGDGDAEVGLPALSEALAPIVAMAAQLHVERARREELERFLDGIKTGRALAGRCPVMRRLQGSISRAAGTDATVLIEGQPGSGKSLAARMIHCGGKRADRPLHAVDCADVDAEGMARLIDETSGTTLVLEGIERLPNAAQSVLVKHLKERSRATGKPAPRIVATTSAHLPELIARGVVREDLYYRLNAFPLTMPSLREHPEDIREIAESVLQMASAHSGRTAAGFTEAAIAELESMPWPGNVTQLEAIVSRAHLLAAGSRIDRDEIAVSAAAAQTPVSAPNTAPPTQERESEGEVTEDQIRTFEEEEQHLLSRALRATKGNVRRAAQLLGIGRATLYRKIQQYKLRMQ